MRILVTLFLTLVCCNAAAQSDYSVTWDIVEFESNNSPNRIILDLNEGTRFITANGVVEFEDVIFATSGTCFPTNDQSIFCNLTIGFFSMEIEVDLDDLGGIAFLIDFDGFLLDTGFLEVVEIQ